MAKKLPTPSPEQGKKLITTIVSGSLTAGLSGAKKTGSALGLSAQESAIAYHDAVRVWLETH